MANFRVESVLDRSSGLYYVEVFYPDTATEPIVSSEPIYPSHEAAEADSLKTFCEAFKGKPISASR